MKDIKNYLIAILTGLLVLTVSMQNSNGATSTVTTAQFKALEARVKVLETNSTSQPTLKSMTISYVMAERFSSPSCPVYRHEELDLPSSNFYRYGLCTLTVLVP